MKTRCTVRRQSAEALDSITTPSRESTGSGQRNAVVGRSTVTSAPMGTEKRWSASVSPKLRRPALSVGVAGLGVAVEAGAPPSTFPHPAGVGTASPVGLPQPSAAVATTSVVATDASFDNAALAGFGV